MTHVSRPLIGLLVATVAVFALWIVALKPSGSSSGSPASSLGHYSSAIAKAHAAVATSAKANARLGAAAGNATTPAAATPTPAASTPSASSAATTTSSKQPVAHAHRTAAAHRFVAPRPGRGPAEVTAALRAGRPLAILFYNPVGADDQAVRSGLDQLRLSARVLKLAVPIERLAAYSSLTQQVEIGGTPTLVIVNRARQASTIVGFTTAFEIVHRIDAALSVR